MCPSVSSLLDRPAAADHHVVQFYECDADLVERAGSYLGDTEATGALAIVIATEDHRRAFEGHLLAAGIDVAAARDEGTLVLLDAASTLARFMGPDGVDRDAFFEVIGGVVGDAVATGRPVRAFGEMVALLWEAGDVLGAIDLETLWNELGTQLPFSLYCAYRSESVAGHEHADALERMCHLHSAVVHVEPPVEATWHFDADLSAPGAARRLLTDVIRGAGQDADLVEDARLIVTELAANAVLHAGSPFSVSILSHASTLLPGGRSG